MKRTYNGNKGIGLTEWNSIPLAEKAAHIKPGTVKTAPSRQWRKHYECKVTKGNHLPKPGTPNIRYLTGDWRTEDFNGRKLPLEEQYRWVHCVECGKHGMEFGDGRLRW